MRFLFCILLLLFFSCTNKEEPKYLSANKMRQVMWDMIRADQYVSDFLLKDSTKKKKDESLKLYEAIFRIHGITEEQFKKSLDHYTSSPDLFKSIIDSLAKQRTENKPYFTHPPNKINRDSIMRSSHRKPLPSQ